MKHDQPPQWDLSDLYKEITDPQIDIDKKNIAKLTERFIRKYKDKLNKKTLTSSLLLEALKEYERIESLSYQLGAYSHLQFSVATTDVGASKFQQATTEFLYELSAQLTFFTTEWRELDDLRANELIADPALENYRNYLGEQRKFGPHTLSAEQETILTKKSQSGSAAFVKLYDKVLGNSLISFKLPGEKTKRYTIAEMSKYMTVHADRRVRKSAHKAVSRYLEGHSLIITEIINSLILDKKISDELRHYDAPQTSSYLSDSIEPDTVQVMSEAITASYDTVARFYQIKAKTQQITKLYEWDRYSKFADVQEPAIEWGQAKETIVKHFTQFDTEFGQIANSFFSRKRIDARTKPGKSGGGYCMYIPGHDPYIMVNFTGTNSDVRVLAHELGHAIHGVLAKKQTPLNLFGSTPGAEIASIFCEEIIFRALFENAANVQTKINLLGGKLQDDFATVHRQNVFHIFESRLHELRKASELSYDQISDLWQQEVQKMFGQSLTLSVAHRQFWMPISHIFHHNFYTYSYCFGKLLAVALYGAYTNEGASFIQNYKRSLALGGSKSIYDVIRTAGNFDLNASSFWQTGLATFKHSVAELENMVKNYKI